MATQDTQELMRSAMTPAVQRQIHGLVGPPPTPKPTAATTELIKHLEKNEEYECFTSSLWVNIFAVVFLLNDQNSWSFVPEFSHGQRRCDLVLMQSQPEWPAPFNAIGLPFVAVEFKRPGASEKQWEDGYQQMHNTITYMQDHWDRGQPVFGIVAAGTICKVWMWDQWKKELVEDSTGRLDLAKDHDREEIFKILGRIKACCPHDLVSF